MRAGSAVPPLRVASSISRAASQLKIGRSPRKLPPKPARQRSVRIQKRENLYLHRPLKVADYWGPASALRAGDERWFGGRRYRVISRRMPGSNETFLAWQTTGSHLPTSGLRECEERCAGVIRAQDYVSLSKLEGLGEQPEVEAQLIRAIDRAKKRRRGEGHAPAREMRQLQTLYTYCADRKRDECKASGACHWSGKTRRCVAKKERPVSSRTLERFKAGGRRRKR